MATDHVPHAWLMGAGCPYGCKYEEGGEDGDEFHYPPFLHRPAWGRRGVGISTTIVLWSDELCCEICGTSRKEGRMSYRVVPKLYKLTPAEEEKRTRVRDLKDSLASEKANCEHIILARIGWPEQDQCLICGTWLPYS